MVIFVSAKVSASYIACGELPFLYINLQILIAWVYKFEYAHIKCGVHILFVTSLP